MPDNITRRGKSDHRTRIKARHPNDKRRVLLAHALRAFNRAAATFANPAKPELQNAKHKRNCGHERELSAVPQVGKAHLANVETRLRKDDEHRECPDEHGVFLEFRGVVGKFRIKVAEPECKRKRDADNRLDGVEDFPGDFGKVSLGPSQVAKDYRDAEARNQVSAEENLERQGRTAAKHFRHRRSGICRRAKRDNRTAEQYFARQVEQFDNSPKSSNDDKACDKSSCLDFKSVTVRLRRNFRHERKEHHDADCERQERRQKMRLRNEDAGENGDRHENSA